MRLRRLSGVLLLAAALGSSRGLFAQQQEAIQGLPDRPPARLTAVADQSYVWIVPGNMNFLRIQPFQLPRPRAVKALYVNAWAFGSNRLWHLVRLADSTDINALVVDVKDDTGCLLYRSAVHTAQLIGANACLRTTNVAARLDTLRAHGIYPIARLVVAKDPLLAEHKPAWSVRSRSGGLWRDRIGSAWVDAYNDSVWTYAADLAREALRTGFAEVQFDYVRFPDEPRARMATAIFPARRPGDTPREAVRRHVHLLTALVKPLGAPVTFDVFGLAASASGDLGIGQVWEDFVAVADVVLPMVYPSHYDRGAFGFRSPNAHPYKIVHLALTDALARTAPNNAEIRPYLQGFTLGRRRPRYTALEIQEQIRAALDLGIESWVLWNPRSVYHRAALPPYASGAGAGRVGVTSNE